MKYFTVQIRALHPDRPLVLQVSNHISSVVDMQVCSRMGWYLRQNIQLTTPGQQPVRRKHLLHVFIWL